MWHRLPRLLLEFRPFRLTRLFYSQNLCHSSLVCFHHFQEILFFLWFLLNFIQVWELLHQASLFDAWKVTFSLPSSVQCLVFSLWGKDSSLLMQQKLQLNLCHLVVCIGNHLHLTGLITTLQWLLHRSLPLKVLHLTSSF